MRKMAMKKAYKRISLTLYMIISLLLIIPIPSIAVTTVEYSADNLTWATVDQIDETNKFACQGNLNESTTYYFRAKEPTTAYSYVSARTKSDGEMELAIMVGLWILTALLAAATAYFDTELKLFFLVGAFITIPFNLNIMANLATAGGVSATTIDLLWTLYRVSLIILLFIVLYVGIKIFTAFRISKKTALEADTDKLNKGLPR